MEQQYKAKYRKDNVKPEGVFGGRVCANCGGKIEGGYKLYRPNPGFSHLATRHVSAKTCERLVSA